MKKKQKYEIQLKLIEQIRKTRRSRDTCKLCITDALTILMEKRNSIKKKTKSLTDVDINQSNY